LFVCLFVWLNELVCLFCNLCEFFARKRLECNVVQFKRFMVVVDDAHSIYDGNEWKTMKMDKLILLVMLTCRIRKDFAKKKLCGRKQRYDTNKPLIVWPWNWCPRRKAKVHTIYLPNILLLKMHMFFSQQFSFVTMIFLLHFLEMKYDVLECLNWSFELCNFWFKVLKIAKVASKYNLQF
jgi:hypothetical protein